MAVLGSLSGDTLAQTPEADGVFTPHGAVIALLQDGEGEERDELEEAIRKHNLTDIVKLYGFVSNPYPYLKNADLFVLSSQWEDPGHDILEAAALRVPIV